MTRIAPRLRRPGVPSRAWLGGAWWLVPFLLASALYFWTATSGGNGAPFAGEKTDYYNLMVDSFRDGRLDLLVKPSPELLALPDPYDPVANAPYRLHDASLYHGRYYLYFGPTPALVAFLPWSLLPLGGDLPGNLVAALFAALGLLFNLLLLRFIRARWLPDVPDWAASAGAVMLAVGNTVPFVLRRPAVYEQVITAGYCFSAAAAWLVITGLYGPSRSLRRIGLGSLCLGLAVGCRPNFVLLGGLLLVVAVVLWRSEPRRIRAVAIVLGPLTLCGIALLVYNAARFGNPAEFGQSYQLAGVDVRLKDSFSPAYLIPGLFYYLLAPARYDLVFPFFHISPPRNYPWSLPAGYDGTEAVGGVFSNLPLLILALVALALPWHARIGLPRTLARILACLTGAGVILAVFVSLLFWGATARYEVDFAWLLALPAVVVWLALAERLRERRYARRAVQAAGVLAIAWGVCFSLAISLTGYYDTLKGNRPETYRAIARLGSPLQTAAAVVAGKPLMLEITGASIEGRGPGERYISSATLLMGPQFPGPTEVLVVSPSNRDIRLRGGLQSGAPGSRVRITGAGPARTVGVDDGPLDVKVRLRRGLNTLRFEPLAAGGGPVDVRIIDLRLRD